jgi:hypothetical protein
MNSLAPRLETLPESQRNLWPQLGPASGKFVLYGGTALSLRVGGRQSIDFDFFSDGAIVIAELLTELPFLQGATLLRQGKSEAIFSVQAPKPVRISFFGDLAFGRVDEPAKFSDNGVVVAGLLDLAAQKVKVVQQRAEAKDYIDIATLLRSGVSLERALGAAQMLYPELNPMITLKALTFFEDGDLASIPSEIRAELDSAVSKVRQIPLVPKIANTLMAKGIRKAQSFEFPPVQFPEERSRDRDMEL